MKPLLLNRKIMKTQLQKVTEILNEEFYGHPSREDEHDIEQLKKAVQTLANEIDSINAYLRSQHLP